MKFNLANLHLTDKEILIEQMRTIRKPIISSYMISNLKMEKPDVREDSISRLKMFYSPSLREIIWENRMEFFLRAGDRNWIMIERYLRRTEKETKAQEFHFKITNRQIRI